jgi:ATP-dependent DNA ligase
MLNLLNQLAATSGTNDKIALLKSYVDDPVVRAVFLFAYNPRIKFWIKKRSPATFSRETGSDLMGAIVRLVVTVASRKVTGNEAIEYVTNLLNNLSADDQEVLYRIIERDLKCGVSAKTINKVWKDLIPEYPVLLCGKFNEKTEKNIKYPAILQCKMDSSRINLEFDGGKFISATTRNGNILDISCFDNIEIATHERCILDGELMWRYPDGRVAERKVSNGYVTKAVRGTITSEEAEGLYVVLWDYIPYDDFLNEYCSVGYATRFKFVGLAVPTNQTKLQIVESEIVNSREEVMQKYQRNLERGEEGCILKAMDGVWEAKRSKYQLKLKADDPVELLVVGFEYGTPGTQFECMLGSLICETACGRLRVNVGSGFKHKLGERDNPESYIGKIVTVNYNCVITSRDSDIKSLFLPIYKGIRYDKNVANTLEDIE